jgi:hypothetical protein
VVSCARVSLCRLNSPRRAYLVSRRSCPFWRRNLPLEKSAQAYIKLCNCSFLYISCPPLPTHPETVGFEFGASRCFALRTLAIWAFWQYTKYITFGGIALVALELSRTVFRRRSASCCSELSLLPSFLAISTHMPHLYSFWLLLPPSRDCHPHFLAIHVLSILAPAAPIIRKILPAALSSIFWRELLCW